MCSNRIRSPCLTSTTSFSFDLISSLYGFISHLLFSSLCVYVVIWIVRAFMWSKHQKCQTSQNVKRGQKMVENDGTRWWTWKKNTKRIKVDKSKITLKTTDRTKKKSRIESNGKWNICLKFIAFFLQLSHVFYVKISLSMLSVMKWNSQVYWVCKSQKDVSHFTKTHENSLEIGSKLNCTVSTKCEFVENYNFFFTAFNDKHIHAARRHFHLVVAIRNT